jgi:N-methylhydantoinase B/oxoprolinase/acetone carboxylase alpha subunit
VGVGRQRARRPGENWLLPAGDVARARRLADKCTIQVHAGDVVRMLTQGGGDWGALPVPKNL